VKKTARFLVFGFGMVVLAGLVAAFVPNPLRDLVVAKAKAEGYADYSPAQAYDLAKKICAQCHSEERIKKYCERCGPPFIVVVPHMQIFMANYATTKPNLKIMNITQSQASAIVQVWNAVIGNWEGDFREKDVLKMIGGYDVLKTLYETPVEKRPIESALMNRDDLKVGYMAEMKTNRGASGGKPEGVGDNAPESPGRGVREHDAGRGN